MSTVTRNAASNAGERIISAILTLLVVPVQVRLLGIEAYGLLGFIASLQVVFNILDFGLGPTIIREVAAGTVDGRAHNRALFQTFSGLYWSIALAAGFGLALAAPWLADRWLQAGALPAQTVILAIRLIAVSILLRWPVSLYAGAIAGVQRLDIVNAIRIATSVFKLLGGLLVLVLSRSLVAYLVWLAVAALAEVSCYVVMSARLVPGMSFRPGISRAVLQRVWRFSFHMNLISMLAVVFAQADRFAISRLLPLAELGFYSVAYSLVSGLSVIQSIVTTALFPALVQQVGSGDPADVRRRCGIATELLMYAVCGAGGVLIFYGRNLIAVWISAGTAARSARPVAILAFGFIASAATCVPFTLSIAAGQTITPLAVNLSAAVVYIPALYWLVTSRGIEGAAWAWVGLNAYYLLILLPLLQRRLPIEPIPAWFARHVLPFVAASLVLIGGSRAAATFFGGAAWTPAAWLAAGGLVYAAVAFAFLDKRVWRQIRTWRLLIEPASAQGT